MLRRQDIIVLNLHMDVPMTMTMGMRKATMIAVMTTVITMIMIVMIPTIVVATTMTVKTMVTGSAQIFKTAFT